MQVIRAAAVGLIFFFAAGAVQAQRPGDGPGRGENAEEALEALLIVSLKRDLGLETAQAVDLAGRARGLLEARRNFSRKQGQLRKELADAVDSAAPDAAHLDRLVQSVFELRAGFAAEQQRQFGELAKDMDALQRARLFVSLERFEERVRKHLRDRADQGRGRRRDRGDEDDL